MKTMKNIAVTVLLLSFISACAGAVSDNRGTGTFRGKWWNYYDRGLASAEKGDLAAALDDLKQAASMRSADQRMARTYGMHFVDYFPHRETGIVYFNQGDLDKAVAELEESVKNEESAKAAFYLNKVRQQLLQKQGKTFSPPALLVDAADKTLVKTSSLRIKGKASAPSYVARITVNNIPVQFDLAKKTIDFDEEVALEEGSNEIAVVAEDLLGNTSRKTVTVVVDREAPLVNITDVAAVDKNGEKFIKVTGEVKDSSGVREVSLDGRLVSAGSRTAFPFEVVYPRAKAGKLTIRAVDVADNEMTAEIDVAKELVAFNRPFKPYMLAFNVKQILLLDTEPPTLELKDTQAVPEVFVDKYFVEGQAFDNRWVDHIVINNKEVPQSSGRKIFFSKIVDLKEGRNAITIDAYDLAGNKSTKTIMVTRVVPSVMQNNARMRVTVLPIDGGGSGVSLAYDRLIGAFVEQKRFNVVERAKLDRVLMEQKLTKEKLTDPQNSIRVGKLMSADAVLATTVKEDSKSIEMVSRVISSETSEVLDVKDVYMEDKGSAAIGEMTAGLASKVAGAFPLIQGIVVKSGSKDLLMDLGDKAKIKKNESVIVFRRGREIKHPITGKSLGFETIKLAEGRIEDIQADYSKVQLLNKPGSKAIRVKDLIITK